MSHLKNLITWNRVLFGLILVLTTNIIPQVCKGQKARFVFPPSITVQDYDPQKLVVKIRNIKSSTSEEIESVCHSIKAKGFKKAFNKSKFLRKNGTPSDFLLENIYVITIDENSNLEDQINRLRLLDNVAYAEPYYLPKPLFIPNDPDASTNGAQTYLSILKAYEAWEFEKGNEEIIIGVLDTGTDLNHEDLVDNIYRNEADPINGIDDDNDGYIDNYFGWDFGNNDNDPTADKSTHGTAVSGISSASTNNGVGIAGLGFNCKFMPIKIFTSEQNFFNQGYAAIIYAAEMGCDVINLSWGSPGGYSNFSQDVINYVVNDLDVVVVAAAGNTNADLDFYPASYENVLSVGASNNNDLKAGFATYSHFIDLMAPGQSEYSTRNNNTYGSGLGSSFSCPMVAGLAGLVRSRYPELNAKQVMEKIRVGTDDIYSLPGNSAYFEMLGKGRANALKAISPSNQPAIRATNINYGNEVGPYAIAGDSLFIKMDFVNYLNSSSNATATLSSNSPYVTITQNNFNIGGLSAMGVIANDSEPFKVIIDPATPENEKITFRIGFQDINYTDFQFFNIFINPNYLNLDNGKIAVTIADDGYISYVNANLTKGNGFVYEGSKILDHIGIAFGSQPDKVVNNIINDLSTGQKSADFSADSGLEFISNSLTPIDIRSSFNDDNAANPIGLKINQRFLSYVDDTSNQFIVVEYRITNVSGVDLPDLYTGIYADFDIGTYSNNRAEFDADRKMGYIFEPLNSNQYAGIALLSNEAVVYNAIDLGNFNGNVEDLSNPFDINQKYSLLNTSSDESAGSIGSGNDVAQFISAHHSLLKNNQSIKIAFAIAVNEQLVTLIESVEKAKLIYEEFKQTPVVAETIGICPGFSTLLNPKEGTIYKFYSDADTTNLLTIGETLTTGILNKDTSFYIVNADLPYLGDIEEIQLILKNPDASFNVDRDTVFIDETNDTAVHFIDNSNEASSWDWDFDNGFYSIVKNPTINFDYPGVYNVNMAITSTSGCTDQFNKTIVAIQRSPKPIIGNFEICAGNSVNISASNTIDLEFYSDENLENLIATGNELTMDNILSDTSVFVVNVDTPVESIPLKVTINVNEISAEFENIPAEQIEGPYETINFIASDPSISNWTWYLDGTIENNNAVFEFNPDGENSHIISLTAQNDFGCIDSVAKNVIFSKTPVPEDLNLNFCFGENIKVSPGGEIYFNFYSDENKSIFIGKGKDIDLGIITESKIIYYTSMENLIESDPAQISVSLITDFADFELENETVYLNPNEEITFFNNSLDISETSWYIDDKFISDQQNLEYTFDQAGNYAIRLEATHNAGCQDEITKNIKVLLVTAIDPLLSNQITIYPIPANDQLYFKNLTRSTKPYQYQIIDGYGKSVQSGKIDQHIIDSGLSIDHMKPGIYYIRLYENNNISSAYKFIID